MAEIIAFIKIRRCTVIWLLLMLLTIMVLILGNMNLNSNIAMLIVLITTFLKGKWIADFFMGLRHTRLLWRLLIWGWLLVVAGTVSLAYMLT